MNWENIIKKDFADDNKPNTSGQSGAVRDQTARAVYARKREEVKELALGLIDILGDMDTAELNATEEKIVKDIKQIQDDMEKSFSNRIDELEKVMGERLKESEDNSNDYDYFMGYGE